MTDTPLPPPPARSVEEEAEAIAREFAHDSIVLARRGLRIAERLGAKALKKAEEVTDKVADDLRSSSRRSPPPPPPTS